MRTKRFLQNLVTSAGGQFLSILLQFAGRTVFIYTLGAQYLGISGLFTNIISVLNVTELGLGAAIVYSLYEPLANNDKKKTASVMQLLRKAYFFVGLFILIAGIILIPFLPYIMKKTTDLVNIPFVFMLYVMQSVSSYWFYAYKSLIFKADQKSYMTNLITYLANIIGVIVQILILLTTKSFILYTVTGISINIFGNFMIAGKVDKHYPYLKEKAEPLPKEEQKEIFKSVVGTSVYKVNAVIVRSTDNIIISAFISTIAVGFYDNYRMITNTLVTFAKMLFGSATAGIGNFVIKEDRKQSEFLFRVMSVMAFWVYGFCTICLWVLINPFISLSWGADYVFGRELVAIIVLDFMMDGFQTISIIYKDACGLFWQGKYRPVATAVLNLMISLALVKNMGIMGVVLGTIISRFLTTWWFEPWLVYHNVFKMSCKNYFIRYVMACIVVLCNIVVIDFLTVPFSDTTFVNMMVKAVFCFLVPNLTAVLILHRTPEFQYLRDMVMRFLDKLRGEKV